MRHPEIAIMGELEKEIMEIIWRNGNEVGVREVVDKLTPHHQVAYTTVMTVMGRLVEKGLLKRSSEAKAYTYKASYSKDKFISQITKQIINSLVSNFGDIAVAHFAEELEHLPQSKKQKLIKKLKKAY